MSADRFAEITAIVKERYETGAYGTAHFKMPRLLFDAVRAAGPPPAPRVPWAPNLDSLLAIPIVIDESLGPDEWRLVDTLTKEVLASGGSVVGVPLPEVPR